MTGDYTMLGRDAGAVGRARLRAVVDARWNIVAQQLLLAELEHATDSAELVLERCVGRLPARPPASAARTSSTPSVRNPVFLTGDWHSTFVNDSEARLQGSVAEPSPRSS